MQCDLKSKLSTKSEDQLSSNIRDYLCTESIKF